VDAASQRYAEWQVGRQHTHREVGVDRDRRALDLNEKLKNL
jgi:hypothetical protein